MLLRRLLPPRGAALAGWLRTPSTAAAQLVEVACIDPRLALDPGRLQQQGTLEQLEARRAILRLRLPLGLLPQLPLACEKLGDSDDPSNHWVIGRGADVGGQQVELFQYRLVGTVATRSGYAALLPADELAALARGRRTAGLPAWRGFRQDLEEGGVALPSLAHPFLFVGRVVDSPEAALYQLEEGGEVVGLLLSSEGTGAGGDDDDEPSSEDD